MSKYIDANDLLNRALADEIEFRDVDGIYETGVTIKDLMRITDEMPESIIRCKDCVYRDGKHCKLNHLDTVENAYCWEAELRESDE